MTTIDKILEDIKSKHICIKGRSSNEKESCLQRIEPRSVSIKDIVLDYENKNLIVNLTKYYDFTSQILETIFYYENKEFLNGNFIEYLKDNDISLTFVNYDISNPLKNDIIIDDYFELINDMNIYYQGHWINIKKEYEFFNFEFKDSTYIWTFKEEFIIRLEEIITGLLYISKENSIEISWDKDDFKYVSLSKLHLYEFIFLFATFRYYGNEYKIDVDLEKAILKISEKTPSNLYNENIELLFSNMFLSNM